MSLSTVHIGKEKRMVDKKPIFDPTISWGDVLMAVTLVIGGMLAYSRLQAQQDVQATEIKHNASAIISVSTELKDHKVDSLKADNEMRSELKTELRDINSKLDRISERFMERELNGTR